MKKPSQFDSAPPLETRTRRGAWRVIGLAGVICGVLDIGAAFIHAYVASGVTPLRVLQSVAGGLLGARSFQLGATSAAFGLALHFCVALAWAALFYAAAQRTPALVQRAVVSGLAYGAFVYAAMTIVVLPFAAWFRSWYLHTPVGFAPQFGIAQALIHLGCVGLPISLVMRKFLR